MKKIVAAAILVAFSFGVSADNSSNQSFSFSDFFSSLTGINGTGGEPGTSGIIGTGGREGTGTGNKEGSGTGDSIRGIIGTGG